MTRRLLPASVAVATALTLALTACGSDDTVSGVAASATAAAGSAAAGATAAAGSAAAGATSAAGSAAAGATAAAGSAGAAATGAAGSTGAEATGAAGSAGSAGTGTGTGEDTVTAIAAVQGSSAGAKAASGKADDSTSLILDKATVTALTSLGVKLAPLGSAKFDAGTGTITFPVSSGYAEVHSDRSAKPGYVQGSLHHQGSGFSLTAGGTKVELTDFVVDPGNSKLHGTVNGANGSVHLLDLDGSDLKVSMEGSDLVLFGTVGKLSETAVGALNKSFKTDALKAGTPLGVARIKLDATEANTYPASDATAIPRLSGEATNVTLDAGTVKALTGLGVKVAPVGDAKVAGGVASFPITGGMVVIHKDKSYQPGWIAGSVIHDGSGLEFSAGGKKLTLTDFVVDPGTSLLTGTVGKTTGVPLLDLDGSDVEVAMEGSNVVLQGTVAKLHATAAKALNTTFGTTAVKAGMPLGVVRVVAVAGE